MSFPSHLHKTFHALPWKTVILSFTLSQYCFESLLSLRQYGKLQEKKPPKTLEGIVDQATFDKSQTYGRAKARFGFVTGAFDILQNIAIITYDVLPRMWAFTAVKGYGEIVHSLAFLGAFSAISTLLGLPLSIYGTFVLEESFGFNKQTPWLFFTDLVKGQALTIAIGGPVIAAFLKIIMYFGANFYYYLWLFTLVFQIVAIALFPTLIQPLFNKLTPLEEGKLKLQVESLASKLKFPLKQLYVIDGSKRSSHSNAYFYGLPWSKRIVIYDTLIEKSETEEVVAVLAHELGHWGLSHSTKMLLISQLHIFSIFALFSVFLNNRNLYASFGFVNEMPVLIGFILFNDVLQPVDSILTLLMNIMSRKHEYEADRYAVKLNYADKLKSALVKLQIQNLSTMDADWLYSAYHYSHPILHERLAAIDKTKKAVE